MSDSAGEAKPTAMSAEDTTPQREALNLLDERLKNMALGYLETLPIRVRKRVEALRTLQSKHDELEAEFEKELTALEVKYEKLYEPLYQQRASVVVGDVEPEDQVDAPPPASAPPAEGAAAAVAEDVVDAKGVPNFWLTAMKNFDMIGEMITARDEPALKYVRDVKWNRLEDGKSFKIDFLFNENPYFSNSVLSKTYHMIEEDEPVLEKSEGTEIDWLAGKNLCVKVMQKRTAKKGNKPGRIATKTEKCKSFFNFFSAPEIPDELSALDEEEAEQLQEIMEEDYEVGAAIREKLIPHAVSWFTGEAVQEEDEEDDEGDEEDDEDDDDEDDDGEDEDEAPAARKKGGDAKSSKSKTGKAGEDQPPDCKQQ
eukprot:TRINITY_DN267_c0_g1_i1.p1 TRINITY_DN267_c0_g1~~TRINITY_DN267_c0_g1_i1.p1  ORF type:complete len:369 (+),score=102.86 TRINITY_DN267_c0_g1_i1:335-1441(+)